MDKLIIRIFSKVKEDISSEVNEFISIVLKKKLTKKAET